MENKIKIGDTLWHPCSMDIIEHKVISIRQYEGFNHYICKAVHNVGACGKVEVILDEHKGKLRFIELINEENIEHSSGLQDFVEGDYFLNEKEAQLVYYRQQELLWSSSVYNKKQIYEEALKNYEKVQSLIKNIRKSLKEEQNDGK